MDMLEIIHTRRSIRQFTSEPVNKKDVETLLHAAMVSPTAKNSQCWRFVVIDDRALLDAITLLSPYTGPAKTAQVAILVCAETELSGGYWQQDAGAAIQTMMLAARALNLGSLWCGIYPAKERAEAFKQKFGLPQGVEALGLCLVGHTDQPLKREDRYDPEKVHYNHW